MTDNNDYSDVDLYNLMAAPLYFGLFVNVLAPLGVLFVCYWANQNYSVTNKVGDLADPLFWGVGLLSVAQAGFALWWRTKRVQRPMIHREQTFQQDLRYNLVRLLRPVFILIAGICVYGYLFFYLTGRFEETVFIVVLSFLVFQVVRPRMGMVKKIVDHQKELVKQKKFAHSSLRLPEE